MRELLPVATAVEKAARVGLRKAGRAVLETSNRKAPQDDGDLIRSGAVRMDDLTVQVSYTAFHATFQHERLDYRHDDGGSAKFLETAFREVDVPAIIADSVRRELGG